MSKLNNVFRVLVLALSLAVVWSCDLIDEALSAEDSFLDAVGGKNVTLASFTTNTDDDKDAIDTDVACSFNSSGKTLTLDDTSYSFSIAANSTTATYKDDSNTALVVIEEMDDSYGISITIKESDNTTIYIGTF